MLTEKAPVIGLFLPAALLSTFTVTSIKSSLHVSPDITFESAVSINSSPTLKSTGSKVCIVKLLPGVNGSPLPSTKFIVCKTPPPEAPIAELTIFGVGFKLPEVEAALMGGVQTPKDAHLTEISMPEQIELDLDDDA